MHWHLLNFIFCINKKASYWSVPHLQMYWTYWYASDPTVESIDTSYCCFQVLHHHLSKQPLFHLQVHWSLYPLDLWTQSLNPFTPLIVVFRFCITTHHDSLCAISKSTDHYIPLDTWAQVGLVWRGSPQNGVVGYINGICCVRITTFAQCSVCCSSILVVLLKAETKHMGSS